MTKPLITADPVTSVAANAARLSSASAALFALLVGNLHLLEPEFVSCSFRVRSCPFRVRFVDLTFVTH
jgi:hypothetical protein